jgi:hydrogenase maturation protease
MSLENSNNVIIGVGNKALSDDAVGIKVARYIIKNHPHLSSLRIIDAGLLNYQISSVLENAHNLIIVQAATLGHAPGTVSTLVGKDMDRILKREQRNSNEMALADMLEMARLARRLPPNRAFITVEPKKVSWGTRLSACVSRTIPQLADDTLALMSLWTGIPLQKESEQETSVAGPHSHTSLSTQQSDN